MILDKELAPLIDHALLRPDLTDNDIRNGCALADRYQVASVCVRPSDVAFAAELLVNSKVKVSTVIGFPHGSTSTRAKLEETVQAITSGAVELDVVLHIGKLRSGDTDYVENELQMLIDYAHQHRVKVKVIFEICYLNREEIIKACKICNEVGADWVKTSTGFGSGVATPEAVQLMREHTRSDIQIKASGGIRTREQALLYQELGCTRIGTSSTEDLLSPS